MKTVKRIISVILLAVILTAVGYLCFTGSRLPSYTDKTESERSVVYEEAV